MRDSYWIERADGAVLLRRRPETGLLGGMMEFPGTDWTETGSTRFEDTGLPGLASEIREAGAIRHTFTHFHLELSVHRAQALSESVPDDCHWCPIDQLGERALPTVMRKVAKAALSS